MEVAEADDNPCYYYQLHIDFKVYRAGVQPLEVDLDTFNLQTSKVFHIGPDGHHLVTLVEAILVEETKIP